MPAPVNAHTHVGDAVARGEDVAGLTLAQVVAWPDSVKERALRTHSRPQRIAATRRILKEAADAGTPWVIDFREQGPDGVRSLHEALQGLPVRAVALGRPEDPNTEDVDLIDAALDVADGIGLSALRDMPFASVKAQAERARERGKRFALHVSEPEREPLERALEVSPDFVVHMVYGTREDFEALAEADVPVVSCPRSNERFGPLPPLEVMLAAGATVALGTDNSFLQTLDVFEEMRFVRERFPSLADEDILRMGLDNGWRVLGEREPQAWLLLDPRGREPSDAVLRHEPRIVARSWLPPTETHHE